MPLSVSCAACGARVRLPDGAAGRRFRCPRCKGVIQAPPASEPAPDNPFAYDNPTDATDAEPEGKEPHTRRRRRPTALPRSVDGFNPFDESTADADDGPRPTLRKYRKGSGWNPFESGSAEPESGPTPEETAFEFGVEAAAEPGPSSDFDFGPPDPRDDDGTSGRRRR
ncbi:MAG TPA: hypothetical protein VKD90_30560 [Gemmataceae bacterium]|nr:hypothetical protein [Gemmataceae bacterium]